MGVKYLSPLRSLLSDFFSFYFKGATLFFIQTNWNDILKNQSRVSWLPAHLFILSAFNYKHQNSDESVIFRNLAVAGSVSFSLRFSDHEIWCLPCLHLIFGLYLFFLRLLDYLGKPRELKRLTLSFYLKNSKRCWISGLFFLIWIFHFCYSKANSSIYLYVF